MSDKLQALLKRHPAPWHVDKLSRFVDGSGNLVRCDDDPNECSDLFIELLNAAAAAAEAAA